LGKKRWLRVRAPESPGHRAVARRRRGGCGHHYVSGEDKAQALAEEIRAKGARAMIVRADVSDEAQVSAMFRAMIADFGTIDILVNNAGLQRDAPFHELTLAQWNRVLGVNLTGQFLCSREAVRNSDAAASSPKSRAPPERFSASAGT